LWQGEATVGRGLCFDRVVRRGAMTWRRCAGQNRPGAGSRRRFAPFGHSLCGAASCPHDGSAMDMHTADSNIHSLFFRKAATV